MVVQPHFVNCNCRDRRVRRRRQVALCAVTAARRLVFGMKTSIAAEAASTGSTPAQVTAAMIIIRSEDRALLEEVLRGDVPLLMAAKRVKRVADLISAYRNATNEDLVKAAKVIGCIYAPPTIDASPVWSANNEMPEAESGQENFGFAAE
jgi:hypothetical protein